MGGDPWRHPTRKIISLLLENKEIVAAIIPLFAGGITSYFASHQLDLSTILIIVGFVILGFLVLLLLRYLIIQPQVREYFQLLSPYEGIWIEKFSVIYDGENTPKKFISVFSLFPNGKTLQMDGIVANREDRTTFSNFTGEVIYEDKSLNHVVYRYKTTFEDGARESATGYGVYNFRKGPGGDTLDRGDGEFVEVSPTLAVRSHSQTSVKRIPTAEVKDLLLTGHDVPKDQPEFEKVLDHYFKFNA